MMWTTLIVGIAGTVVGGVITAALIWSWQKYHRRAFEGARRRISSSAYSPPNVKLVSVGDWTLCQGAAYTLRFCLDIDNKDEGEVLIRRSGVIALLRSHIDRRKCLRFDGDIWRFGEKPLQGGWSSEKEIRVPPVTIGPREKRRLEITLRGDDWGEESIYFQARDRASERYDGDLRFNMELSPRPGRDVRDPKELDAVAEFTFQLRPEDLAVQSVLREAVTRALAEEAGIGEAVKRLFEERERHQRSLD